MQNQYESHRKPKQYRYDKQYPWVNKGEQGRLFEWSDPDKEYPLSKQEVWDAYTFRQQRNIEEANRKRIELWDELEALWNAVKDDDMEDAAEMIYDFVREAMS